MTAATVIAIAFLVVVTASAVVLAACTGGYRD